MSGIFIPAMRSLSERIRRFCQFFVMRTEITDWHVLDPVERSTVDIHTVWSEWPLVFHQIRVLDFQPNNSAIELVSASPELSKKAAKKKRKLSKSLRNDHIHKARDSLRLLIDIRLRYLPRSGNVSRFTFSTRMCLNATEQFTSARRSKRKSIVLFATMVHYAVSGWNPSRSQIA